MSYDAIVIGLGAMGSAAAYQLAGRGKRVLGIDRFSPPHTMGSTHGDTRITRQAIGEGEQYTPLSLRSYEIFRDLEKKTGKKLLTVTGGLIITSEEKAGRNHVEGFFQNTVSAAKKFNIAHDLLTGREIRRRFPQFKVADDEAGYFEHEAGYLAPEECIRAQLQMAKNHAADIRTGEQVLEFADIAGGGVRVKTDRGVYEGGQMIVTSGAWISDFIDARYADLFKVYRQILYWFDIDTPLENFLPPRFPVFIWETKKTEHGLYGFPAVDGAKGGVKIATAQYAQTVSPDTVHRAVNAAEEQEMFRTCVAPFFEGLTPRCIKSVSCLYTVTPDHGFIIDRHPAHKDVIIASACSGHGFKHSAAVGECLAQLVTEGGSGIDVSGFSLGRFV